MFGKFLIAFLVLFGYFSDSQIFASEKTMMTQEQVNELLSSGNFKRVKNKSEIPKVWWEGMALDGMADIGGPFDAGCTGDRPHRRLMAAAVSEPFAVVVCENGGRVHHAVFTVLKRVDDTVLSVYSENMVMQRAPEVLQKLGK